MSTASDAFISKHRELAEKLEAETGIPAARILGQAGHETGWSLDAPGNNFFGVKAGKGWTGKSQSLNTTEADSNGNLVPQKQDFRVYDSPEDSFRDHFKVLSQDNYKGAMQPGIGDNEYAQALKDGGYATDPNYAPKLAGAIALARNGLGQDAQTQPLPPTTQIAGPGPGAGGILSPQPAAAPAGPDYSGLLASIQAGQQASQAAAAKQAAEAAQSKKISAGASMASNGLQLAASAQPAAPQYLPAPPAHRPTAPNIGLLDAVFPQGPTPPKKKPTSLFDDSELT